MGYKVNGRNTPQMSKDAETMREGEGLREKFKTNVRVPAWGWGGEAGSCYVDDWRKCPGFWEGHEWEVGGVNLISGRIFKRHIQNIDEYKIKRLYRC